MLDTLNHSNPTTPLIPINSLRINLHTMIQKIPTRKTLISMMSRFVKVSSRKFTRFWRYNYQSHLVLLLGLFSMNQRNCGSDSTVNSSGSHSEFSSLQWSPWLAVNPSDANPQWILFSWHFLRLHSHSYSVAHQSFMIKTSCWWLLE